MSNSLAPRPAFVEATATGHHGKAEGDPGVVVYERSRLGLATVMARKGSNAELNARVREVHGLDLPNSPRLAVGPALSFIGVGPGHWLAMSDALPFDTLALALSKTLGSVASVSDQSDGRAVIRMRGPRARDVLAKGLPIDLHPRVFGPGSAVTSVIGHISVQLWQVDETPTYDIAAPRSLSESFWRWLMAAAAEFGCRIESD